MQIYFFTTPKPLLHVGHYTPPKSESDIIAKFINLGYAPSVNSVEKPKEIQGKGWWWDGSSDRLSPLPFAGGEIFFACILPDGRGDMRTIMGLLGVDHNAQQHRVTRSTAKLEPFAQPCLKAPSFVGFETLPDGKLVKRIGGDDEGCDRVNELIRKITCAVSP